MPDYRTQDLLRDLERRIGRLENETARLPVTFPTVEASGETTSVLLRRCSDGMEVVASDSEGPNGEGKLSANIGNTVNLLDSAVLDADCWRIVEVVDCQADICPRICFIGTDCNDCQRCVELVPCAGGSNIITRNFCGSIGDVVELSDGNCYTAQPADSCSGAVEVNVIRTVENCNSCSSCWKLERCCDTSEVMHIYRDGHGIDSNFQGHGVVVKINGECWYVRESDPVNDTGSTPPPCPSDPAPVHVEEVGIVKILSEAPPSPYPCEEAACLYDLIPCPSTAGGAKVISAATDYCSGDTINLLALINQYQEEYQSNPTVRLDNGGCYELQISELPCTTAEEVIIQEVFWLCDGTNDCNVWELEQCDAPGTFITTFNDLHEYILGDILKRAEDGLCYEITDVDAAWSGTSVCFTVEQDGYPTCLDCTTPKYRLVADCETCCDGTNPAVKVTDHDLSDSVEQYIKVDGVCYRVEQGLNSETVTDPDPLEFEGPFPACAPCQQECIQVVTKDGDDLKLTTIAVDRICSEEGLTTGECPNDT